LAALATALLVQCAEAAVSGENAPPHEAAPPAEPYNTGWAVNADNDSFRGTDRNYTAGFAVTLSGRRATEYALSLDPALQAVNDWLGVKRLFDAPHAPRRHNIAFGLTMFTPQETTDPAPIFDDQPYGSGTLCSSSLGVQ
jgi:hypothetical protein